MQIVQDIRPATVHLSNRQRQGAIVDGKQQVLVGDGILLISGQGSGKEPKIDGKKFWWSRIRCLFVTG
jgi:hypothetical protein